MGMCYREWKGIYTVMPWVVKIKNDYVSLTQAEMENNATLQFDQIGNRLTLNAFCGLLGNEQWESYLNPGQWQGSYDVGDMDGGYGLVMWTPASKIFNIVGYDGYLQTEAILNRTANDWIPRPDKGTPETWEEFATSYASPERLAEVFLNNYERAGNEHLLERQTFARNWFNFFEGKEPGPFPGTTKKMNISFYLKKL